MHNHADDHGPWDKCGSCWLNGMKWLLGWEGWGGIPINLLYHFCQTPPAYQFCLCLALTFVMVHLLSSFPAMLPGRPLLHETIITFHVLMPIVWLPTSLVLRLAKSILFFFIEANQLYHRLVWWWPMGMFIWGGLMALARLNGEMTCWWTAIIWMPYGGLWSELGSSVVCQFWLI